MFENWNRYYDPGSGRYLSPEPLLQRPEYSAFMAQQGLSAPAYAYAANNPVNFVDPDGLRIAVNWGSSPQGVVNMANAIGDLLSTQVGRDLWNRLDARPETITVSHMNAIVDLTKNPPRVQLGQTARRVGGNQSCEFDARPGADADRGPSEILGHELRHAEQNLSNRNRNKRTREISSQIIDAFVGIQRAFPGLSP